ncbi:MAG: hypothetical protein ACI8QS_003664 [Planctomycetota bacterium]|jgi:hypothetical protein
MRHLNHIATRGVALLCLALLCPGLAASAEVMDQQEDAIPRQRMEKAGALFSKSCIGCHLPPDPAQATDRAWLTQVADTA